MISVVSPLVWAITVVALLAIIILDLAVIGRRQQTVTTKQAVQWVLVHVGLAAAFAVGLFVFAPGSSGQEFVAGYITEYSLSVDNLFVFMIIMARFSVPELAQDKVLYVGIILSLVFRAVFIFAGAAAIAAWSWVFFIHGGVLGYAADNAITFAAGTAVGPEVLTGGFTISYLRPAQGTVLRAEAKVAHAGSRQATCTCELSVVDEAGAATLCAIAQGTVIALRR